MSNIVLTAVLLLVGLTLTVGGVFIYRTGLKLFGFLLGGGAGFFAASTASVGPIPTVAAILLLGFVGLVIAGKIYMLMLLVPGAATAPALILVGVFMMSPVREIEFGKITEALPAFLTMIMMPLAYSIAEGIVWGLISYVVVKLLSGKGKEISIATYVLAAILLLTFIV